MENDGKNGEIPWDSLIFPWIHGLIVGEWLKMANYWFIMGVCLWNIAHLQKVSDDLPIT